MQVLSSVMSVAAQTHPIYQLILNHDHRKICELINFQAEAINFTGTFEIKPLSFAIYHQCESIANLLITKGACLNYDHALSPLAICLMSDQLEWFYDLVLRGAQPISSIEEIGLNEAYASFAPSSNEVNDFHGQLRYACLKQLQKTSPNIIAQQQLKDLNNLPEKRKFKHCATQAREYYFALRLCDEINRNNDLNFNLDIQAQLMCANLPKLNDKYRLIHLFRIYNAILWRIREYKKGVIHLNMTEQIQDTFQDALSYIDNDLSLNQSAICDWDESFMQHVYFATNNRLNAISWLLGKTKTL